MELSFIDKVNVQDLVRVKKQRSLLGYLTTVSMHLTENFQKRVYGKIANDLIVNYLYAFYYCNLIKYLNNFSFNCINGFNCRFYRILLILLMLGNKM